jgi:5-methylcytosine-specific restriction endonuclease McrA
MDSVSQNGRRKQRPWTAQEQITAEVAAACGVSVRGIGKLLGRNAIVVEVKLNSHAASKARAKGKRWRDANPGYYRSYYKSDPAYHREKQIRWNQKNADVIRDCGRRRHALERSARQLALMPATRVDIDRRFALFSKRCAYCSVNASHPRNHGYQRLAEDHVIPLSLRGLDEAANIVPACHSCNSSKNDSIAESWYRRQPFFTEARWRKIQRHCPAAVAGQLPLALPA